MPTKVKTDTKRRGRPRKDALPTNGLIHIPGFDMPQSEGLAVRQLHDKVFAETGQQMGPWLRRVVRKALKIPAAK